MFQTPSKWFYFWFSLLNSFFFAGVRSKIVSFYFFSRALGRGSNPLSPVLIKTLWPFHLHPLDLTPSPGVDWAALLHSQECAVAILLVTERCLALGEDEVSLVAELSPQLVSMGSRCPAPDFLGQSWMQALGITCILTVQTSCAVFINVKKKCLRFFMN